MPEVSKTHFVKDSLRVTIPSIFLLSLVLYGFGANNKRTVVERQNGICPVCRQKLGEHTEGHHKVPEVFGGSKSLENCIVVDAGGNGQRDCHEILDRNAMDNKLVFLSPDQPAVPLAQVPAELFKNGKERRRILEKFNLVGHE